MSHIEECVQLNQDIILKGQCNIFSTECLLSSLTLDHESLEVNVNTAIQCLATNGLLPQQCLVPLIP